MFKFPIRLSFRRSVTFPRKITKETRTSDTNFAGKANTRNTVSRNYKHWPIVVTTSWGTAFIPFYPRPKGTWNLFDFCESLPLRGEEVNFRESTEFWSRFSINPRGTFPRKDTSSLLVHDTLGNCRAMDLLNTILVE